MRSRIHTFKPIKGVIFSSQNTDEIEFIKKYCRRNNIPANIISNKRYNFTVKDILSNIKIFDDEAESENIQILVISGLSGVGVSRMIDAINAHGFSFPYKCVVTEMNYDMTVKNVYAAIKSEHEALHE